MQWFTKESLLAWRASLPDDVLECVEPIDDQGQAAADFIAKLLGELETPDDYVALVREHNEKFKEMGRPRRIRFLAWCTAKFYRDKEERKRLIAKMTESVSGEDEGGSSTGDVGILLLEDIKAFAKAIGPRAANLIVDENTLSTVAGVGMELASDLEMRGGRK